MNGAFKALADPTRRKILQLLAQRDMTAGEIAHCFSMTKPSFIHHLSTLRAAGLIDDERHGQNILYSLNTTVFQQLMQWFFEISGMESKDSVSEGVKPDEKNE